ncbi:MAG: heavy metal translocating P-type ATPase [Synechococcaceae cyanobacterium]
MSRSPAPIAAPPQAPGPILLEVEGLKCGGCVRAVEQRLLQHPAVRDASVNLLNRTAWVDLNPSEEGEPADPVPELRASLAALGFEARRRDEDGEALPGLERHRQRHWWVHWRQLIYALALLLISGLGHLADAGELPWRDPWNLLGRPGFHAVVATLALLGPGRAILRHGFSSALAGLPSMDSLVGLGVFSAYASSLLGWLLPRSGFPCFFNEPVMLLGFVLTGRFLEERARWRTGRALEALVALQPEQALLLSGDGPARPVRVGGLRPGDQVRILPGDRLPVDGLVLRGEAHLDLSSLTGESLPISAGPGTELPAGALNLDATLDLEVRRSGAASAIGRIVRLVRQAQDRKAPIQGLADRVAGRFTLLVLLLALATFLFWWLLGASLWPQLLEPGAAMAGHGHGATGLTGHGMAAAPAQTPLGLALQLAIAVLVVACPCALGLATPAAIAVGLGQAARSGLLFRGGDAIETAARLRTVLFDKTGTLTLGRPLVRRIEVLSCACASGTPLPAGGTTVTAAGGTPIAGDALDGATSGASRGAMSCAAAVASAVVSAGDPTADLLRQAAALEQQSRHPLAHALLQEAQLRGLSLPEVRWCRSVSGAGVVGQLQGDGPLFRVGRLDWLAAEGVQGSGECPEVGTGDVGAGDVGPEGGGAEGGGPPMGGPQPDDAQTGVLQAGGSDALDAVEAAARTKTATTMAAKTMAARDTAARDRGTVDVAARELAAGELASREVAAAAVPAQETGAQETGAATHGEAARLQAELECNGSSVLAVAADDRLLGLIAVQDPPRPDATGTLAALRQRGLRLGLLSGDREEPVRALAAQLGLQAEELAWQLQPEQKQERILAALAQGPVAMVGDGINDAPALAAADLGIAVGTGTQIAQESADLVVLGERLEGLVIALDLARDTMTKVRQNLAWAFGYNLIALPIAAGVLLPGFGLRLSPPLAALLMAGSSITVVLNALLLGRGRRPGSTGR